MRVVVLAGSMFNFALAGMFLLVNLHLFGTGHSSFQVGIVDAASGVGGAFGAATASRMVHRYHSGRLGIALIACSRRASPASPR